MRAALIVSGGICFGASLVHAIEILLLGSKPTSPLIYFALGMVLLALARRERHNRWTS